MDKQFVIPIYPKDSRLSLASELDPKLFTVTFFSKSPVEETSLNTARHCSARKEQGVLHLLTLPTPIHTTTHSCLATNITWILHLTDTLWLTPGQSSDSAATLLTSFGCFSKNSMWQIFHQPNSEICFSLRVYFFQPQPSHHLSLFPVIFIQP